MILNKPAVGWILVSDKIRESDYRNWASGVGCVRYARTRLLKPKTHPRSSENLFLSFSDDLYFGQRGRGRLKGGLP